MNISGLGIDFSPARSVASKLWEDNLPFTPPATTPHPSVGLYDRRMSYWSESTKLTPSVAAKSSTESRSRSTTLESCTVSSQSHSTHHVSFLPRESSSSFFVGRGSDDSQASVGGPVTPADEMDFPVAISHLGLSKDTKDHTFQKLPRKAPQPPLSTISLNQPPMSSPLPRKLSGTHSMLRHLSVKKKEGLVPAPLTLTPNPKVESRIQSPITPLKRDFNNRRPSSPVLSRFGFTSRRGSSSSIGEGSSATKQRLSSFSSIIKSIRQSVSADISRRSSKQPSPHQSPRQGSASPAQSQKKSNSPLALRMSPMAGSPKKSKGKASKSCDFSYISTTGSPSFNPNSLSKPARPTTAPVHQTAFYGKDVDTSDSSPHSELSQASPLPAFMRSGAPLELKIDYSNPWGVSTFAPTEGTFSPSIASLSPGQPAYHPVQSTFKPADRSDADLYKHSILGTLSAQAIPEEVASPKAEPVADGASPASASDASPRSSAPSTPSQGKQKKSKSKTSSKAKKQASEAPILETLGGVTVRNPWASDDKPSAPPQTEEVVEEKKKKRRSSSRRRKSSANLVCAEAEKEYAFVKASLSRTVSAQEPPKDTNASMPSPSIQQTVAEFMDEAFSPPIFSRPFFTRFSDPNVSAIPFSTSGSGGRKTSADSNSHNSSAVKQIRRMPSVNDFSVHRKGSATSLAQSEMSTTSPYVPSRPTRTIVRRGTEVDVRRGIRVSFDDQEII